MELAVCDGCGRVVDVVDESDPADQGRRQPARKLASEPISAAVFAEQLRYGVVCDCGRGRLRLVSPRPRHTPVQSEIYPVGTWEQDAESERKIAAGGAPEPPRSAGVGGSRRIKK